MATAITPLANITLTSATTTVSFTSISGLYRDLMLVVSGKWNTNNSSSVPWYSFNSDTNDANYYLVDIEGTGSSAVSYSVNYRASFASSFGYGNPAPNWQLISHFLDYSATNKHKAILTRVDSPADRLGASAARWTNTSAITSITVQAGLSFAAGSTFSLFGVSA